MKICHIRLIKDEQLICSCCGTKIIEEQNVEIHQFGDKLFIYVFCSKCSKDEFMLKIAEKVCADY